MWKEAVTVLLGVKYMERLGKNTKNSDSLGVESADILSENNSGLQDLIPHRGLY
jgi:hypothetical protein